MERGETVVRRGVWLSPGGYPPGVRKPGTAWEGSNPQAYLQNLLAPLVRKNGGAGVAPVVDLRCRAA